MHPLTNEEHYNLLALATDCSIGGGSGSHCAVGTVHAYGKQMFNSADSETYSSKGPDGATFPPRWISMHTEEEVAAELKREFAVNMVEQTSLWFFDKWGGSYSEDAIRLIGRGKKIWDEEMLHPTRNSAQVLMIVDPANIYYINNFHPNSNLFHLSWKLCLNRSGMPFEIASFGDLPRLDMERFRLVLFCHPFEITLEKQAILEKYVFHSGRTAVWTYGPGIIHDGIWDESNVEHFCRVPFGSEEIRSMNMGNWHSVYVHDPSRMAPERLRELAAGANVWLYCSKPRPTYVNERLAGVHTAEKETLEIIFPGKYARISELFSGQEFRNTDRVQLTSRGPETWLLRREEEMS